MARMAITFQASTTYDLSILLVPSFNFAGGLLLWYPRIFPDFKNPVIGGEQLAAVANQVVDGWHDAREKFPDRPRK